MTNKDRVCAKHSLRVPVAESSIPPIRDGLVLGKHSAIGCQALRKALDLLLATPFEHIEFEDDVISDILVSGAVLRRIPRDKLSAFAVQHVEPLMSADEVLHLELDARVTLEGQGL